MQNSRIAYYISALNALAVSYLLALLAYCYRNSTEIPDGVLHEAQQLSYALYLIALFLLLITLTSIILHFIQPRRPTSTVLITASTVIGTVVSIVLISRFIFAS
jgi:hypothetical protein